VSESGGPVDDGHCVGCGPLSEIGLKMTFERLPDDAVESRLVIPARFQGWRGVTHGGVVALVLDEAMAYAAGALGVLGVTGEMKMRFRGEVPIGAPIVVRGKVLWQRRGVLGVEASVRSADGALLASATGSFVQRGTVQPGTRFAQLA
jgi:acyl-coenzyme A thioesterase PaaI-like protein